ncbi:g-type lectin s-receptor-like serine/threonine-protein kinase ces101 [Quercus suber]|uniref:G-type lectin s-receptor-like serine/threonine-protein kinase ces101 n=1 Tax=Quercus suber TaxID=58331 RepID=A0AAW0M7Q4_QUESU
MDSCTLHTSLKDYYNFSYLSNENEAYFYYLGKYEDVTKSRKLTLDNLGELYNDDNITLANCGVNLPECRNSYDEFSPDYGSWDAIDGFKFNEGDNLTLLDCKFNCWNNCSCVAFASTNEDTETGCEIWSTPSLYWTSSNVLFNLTSSGLTYYGYHFSYISNENETYLNYTGVEENYITRVIRPLKIDYFGRLSDENYTLVDCTSHDDTQGCKAQCRSHDDTFTPVSSSLKDGFKFDESDNLTHKDCEAKCFDNCSCVAYASTNQYAQTGCEIWSTLDRLIGFSNPNARTIYFLASALASKSAWQSPKAKASLKNKNIYAPISIEAEVKNGAAMAVWRCTQNLTS